MYFKVIDRFKMLLRKNKSHFYKQFIDIRILTIKITLKKKEREYILTFSLSFSTNLKATFFSCNSE